ncbi:MAG: Fic family protein [Bacteroidota bacterium]
MAHNLDIVDQLQDTLKKLQPLKPEDRSRLYKKFRLEFNYNSNHIEGNTLTYGETELLLMFDDTRGNHTMREYEETKAHDVAYHMVEELAKDTERPLTEQIIKNLNETILVRPYWKDAITPDGQNTRRQIKVGDYKEYPNSVRLQNGEMFEYASPLETPIKMRELMDWYRAEEHAIHPITLATMLHYYFVRIHPFDDGNGRISRLLMNYVLLKFNYPPVVIKSLDKNNYLQVLHLADVGATEPLINYIAEQVIWSLETSIKAAKGESLEDEDDFIKEIELLKRKVSSKGISKSSKVVYDTFKLLDNALWRVLLKTLKHFDILFNESINSYMLDGIGTVDDGSSKLEESKTDYNDLKIFGHDISNRNVRKIQWQHAMLTLKGADRQINYTLGIEVDFNMYTYIIGVTIGGEVFLNVSKEYNEQFLTEDVVGFEKEIKKHLLDFIKNKIN